MICEPCAQEYQRLLDTDLTARQNLALDSHFEHPQRTKDSRLPDDTALALV